MRRTPLATLAFVTFCFGFACSRPAPSTARPTADVAHTAPAALDASVVVTTGALDAGLAVSNAPDVVVLPLVDDQAQFYAAYRLALMRRMNPVGHRALMTIDLEPLRGEPVRGHAFEIVARAFETFLAITPSQMLLNGRVTADALGLDRLYDLASRRDIAAAYVLLDGVQARVDRAVAAFERGGGYDGDESRVVLQARDAARAVLAALEAVLATPHPLPSARGAQHAVLPDYGPIRAVVRDQGDPMPGLAFTADSGAVPADIALAQRIADLAILAIQEDPERALPACVGLMPGRDMRPALDAGAIPPGDAASRD